MPRAQAVLKMEHENSGVLAVPTIACPQTANRYRRSNRMNHNKPVPPETIRQIKRKNRLWLLVMPPLLALSLVSIVKQGGRSAFVVELAIICLCSFFAGSCWRSKISKLRGSVSGAGWLFLAAVFIWFLVSFFWAAFLFPNDQ